MKSNISATWTSVRPSQGRLPTSPPHGEPHEQAQWQQDRRCQPGVVFVQGVTMNCKAVHPEKLEERADTDAEKRSNVRHQQREREGRMSSLITGIAVFSHYLH